MFTGKIKITTHFHNCTISNTSDTLYLQATVTEEDNNVMVSSTVSHNYCIIYTYRSNLSNVLY